MAGNEGAARPVNPHAALQNLMDQLEAVRGENVLLARTVNEQTHDVQVPDLHGSISASQLEQPPSEGEGSNPDVQERAAALRHKLRLQETKKLMQALRDKVQINQHLVDGLAEPSNAASAAHNFGQSSGGAQRASDPCREEKLSNIQLREQQLKSSCLSAAEANEHEQRATATQLAESAKRVAKMADERVAPVTRTPPQSPHLSAAEKLIAWVESTSRDQQPSVRSLVCIAQGGDLSASAVARLSPDARSEYDTAIGAVNKRAESAGIGSKTKSRSPKRGSISPQRRAPSCMYSLSPMRGSTSQRRTTRPSPSPTTSRDPAKPVGCGQEHTNASTCVRGLAASPVSKDSAASRQALIARISSLKSSIDVGQQRRTERTPSQNFASSSDDVSEESIGQYKRQNDQYRISQLQANTDSMRIIEDMKFNTNPRPDFLPTINK